MKRVDLCKTQFLVVDQVTHQTVRMFTRKRQSMLLDRAGKAIRPMTYAAWKAFEAEYPAEIKADGLQLRNVWTLTEVKA